MRYYISGQISNNSDYKADFERGEMWLRLHGYEAVNPTKCCECEFFSYADFFKTDLALLQVCDGIFVLDNWRNSRGAQTEIMVAKCLGLKVKFESRQKCEVSE